MRSLQQNLLVILALSLCGVCVYQWFGQTLQRNEIQKLEQTVYEKSAAIQDYTDSIGHGWRYRPDGRPNHAA